MIHTQYVTKKRGETFPTVSLPVTPRKDGLVEIERWRHFEGGPELVFKTDDGMTIEQHRELAAQVFRALPQECLFRIAKVTEEEWLAMPASDGD